MKYHKTYTDIMREQNEPIFDHECPNCGWDALVKKGLEEGYCEVIHSQELAPISNPWFELHIKCTCPICNTEFEYFDGSP